MALSRSVRTLTASLGFLFVGMIAVLFGDANQVLHHSVELRHVRVSEFFAQFSCLSLDRWGI